MKAASLNTDVYNNEGKNSDKTADLVMFEVLSFVFFFLATRWSICSFR